MEQNVNTENLSLEELVAKLPPLSEEDSEGIARAAYDALYNKKARNIKIYKVEGKSDIADYMVVGSGTSSTHVKSLANVVGYYLGLRGIKQRNIEGRDNSAWILVDFGSVIVHVQSRDARDFYNLDRLYGAAAEIQKKGATDGEGE